MMKKMNMYTSTDFSWGSEGDGQGMVPDLIFLLHFSTSSLKIVHHNNIMLSRMYRTFVSRGTAYF